jgi:hypothetical protein
VSTTSVNYNLVIEKSVSLDQSKVGRLHITPSYVPEVGDTAYISLANSTQYAFIWLDRAEAIRVAAVLMDLVAKKERATTRTDGPSSVFKIGG